MNAIFRRLRSLQAECRRAKANKHDLAIILIKACIEEGFDTGKRITGTLERLGLNRQHAGKMLTEGTGNDADRHHWHREEDGRYIVHEDQPSR